LSNGVFGFVLHGPVGSNFVIEVSSDLVQWIPMFTNTISGQGFVAFADTNAAAFSQQFYRAVPSSALLLPAPIIIASNLNSPGNMTLGPNNVYFSDCTAGNGIVKSVPKAGGTVSTLLTGLSTSGGYIPTFTADGGIIYGGYGSYNGLNIFSAPSSGGSATTIASTTGGDFFGVANSLVYYGSGFSAINSVTTAGANPTQLASGIWVREVAVDSSGIYFVDYDTKNVLEYSFSSGIIMTLITGNSTEGNNVFTDANNVYFSISGNIEVVPKAGGTVTTLVSSGAANGYACDGTKFSTWRAMPSNQFRLPAALPQL
jgi:hypothetical protein